jgi:hypothetical protein
MQKKRKNWRTTKQAGRDRDTGKAKTHENFLYLYLFLYLTPKESP